MELTVVPERLLLAADAVDRQSHAVLDAAARFAADARRRIPELGRPAFTAAGETADAAHHAALAVAADLDRLAAALRTAAVTYEQLDARLLREGR